MRLVEGGAAFAPPFAAFKKKSFLELSMKKGLSILMIFMPWLLVAQIPAGYYNGMEGKNGATLKTALYNKIKGHTARSYANLWTDFQQTDKRADGKVWDMYSNCTFNWGTGVGGNQDQGSGGTAECQFFNREHSFPKSWFDDATPMYTDLFHLYPTDKYVNNQRGNLPFGETASPTKTYGNGSKLGTCSYPGYSGTVYEPAAEYKGDFARTYFYMVTRYEDVVAGWYANTEAKPTLNGTAFPAFNSWVIGVLMKWHREDPVSTKEIARNDSVCKIQNNRNPFIDHPEYADSIWGALAPVNVTIAQVRLTPASPNASQSPTVSAKISVSKSGVSMNAYLRWGMTSTALNDSVQMTLSDTVYVAQVPTYAKGTVVYYGIAASTSTARSITAVQHYTVAALPDTITPIITEPSAIYVNEEFEMSAKMEDAQSGIKSAKVYVGTTATDISQDSYVLQPQGGNVYGVTFFPLFNFKPVYFTFEACDSANNCSMLVHVYGATGVSGQPLLDFTLYPNPAESEVLLHIPANVQVVKIEIFDLQGVLRIQRNGDNHTVDVSALESGVFFAKITSDKGVGIQRFQVLKRK